MMKNKRQKITLDNIIKEIFAIAGINFERVDFLYWKEVEGRPDPVPKFIESLPEFFDNLVDGRKYQIIIKDAKISRIEQNPFSIPEIFVETSYDHNEWSELKVYDDYEDFCNEDRSAQDIYGRLHKLKARFKDLLQFLLMVLGATKAIDNKYKKIKH